MDPLKNSQNPADDQAQQSVSAPVVPPGSVHKEQGPVATTAPTSEFVKPSETEPALSKELQEMGVESVPNTPDLDQDHADAGIVHAKESVPVKTEPSGTVQLPMTQTQAQSILKLHKKVSDSVVWLATLILKQFKLISSGE